VGTTVPQIGRAKSRGFETVSATESLDINATSSIYRHYLFDIEMFTHLNALGTASYTTGEIVSGATSAATGVVQNITATKNTAVTSISVASPGVVTLTAHGINDGQQVYLTGGTWQIDSSATNDATIYTARNTTTNTFELYESDGTTTVNVTSFSGGPTLKHTTIVVSNVEGTFSAGETITGQTSNASLTLQSNALGFTAVRTRDVSAVKQIGMAGTPTYTADTDLTSTYGDNTIITGNVSIANSDATVLGKGTNFTVDLKIGDSISFVNDAGVTVTGLVKYVVSQTELELTANVGGSDVTTASVLTRKRSKLTNPENNISIFNLPHTTIKTLKTTANGGASDTSYNVRRQFTIT